MSADYHIFIFSEVLQWDNRFPRKLPVEIISPVITSTSFFSLTLANAESWVR